MEENMKLEEFHALLNSESGDNQLIAALRALTNQGKPEDVRGIDRTALATWRWAGG